MRTWAGSFRNRQRSTLPALRLLALVFALQHPPADRQRAYSHSPPIAICALTATQTATEFSLNADDGRTCKSIRQLVPASEPASVLRQSCSLCARHGVIRSVMSQTTSLARE